MLGHSSAKSLALAAADIVILPDAVRIAAKRMELIAEATDRGDGVMLAVTSEDQSRRLDWLAPGQSGAKAVMANGNAPTQVVLSGERSAITACAEFISRKNLGKCCFLAVSGPWHSPFMAAAAAHVDAWLRQITMPPRRGSRCFLASRQRARTPLRISAL